MKRLHYIDWLRGVAVLFMILWHAIDAWTVRTGRDTTAFAVIIFLAGWAAPLFLFLAGVAVPLAGDARMARGLGRSEASWMLQKRGWQVFLIAHLFRLQSFLLNPNGSWNALLKPDVLNILGVGIVVTAFGWGRARTLRQAGLWLVAPAVIAVFVLTPWSREWWWPTLLHPRLEAYIRPVGNFGVFSLFPAVGFVLVGAYIGVVVSKWQTAEAALHRRLAMAGASLVATGAALSAVPFLLVPSRPDSAPFFLWRIGIMTLALSVAWLLLRGRSASSWSPLVVFGQTSLFVYWVHVEIAYGVFGYPIRNTLELPWSLGAYGLLTLFMLGLAVLWQRRPRGPLIPEHMVALSPKPQALGPRP